MKAWTRTDKRQSASATTGGDRCRRLDAVSLACLVFFAVTATAVERPPNIILVLADDLGYGDLGSFGSTYIETPHLDEMARQGVRLTDFYASGSNCTPSRAGLLTGRYAIRSGLAHQVIFVNDEHGLPAEEITIAEMLKPLGYRTAIIGKWHLGHTPQHWPTTQGFDYYFGLPYSNNATPLALYRGSRKIEEPVRQATLTERYTAEAIRFIEQRPDRPFFIYLPHTAPHVPLHVSDGFVGKSRAGLYGDVVASLDWSMGELFSALQRLELDEQTLVIFTSDNGPYPQGSTGGLRGSKGTPWEGGYRVPFIARWPGHIPAGAVSNGIAMNIDLLPTLRAISGAALPAGLTLDGKNITGLLKGSNDTPHEALYYFSDGQIAGVRTRDWKMLVQARYRGIDRRLPEHDVLLLFDMRTDPQERYSLAAHRPDKWQELQAHLERGRRELEPLACMSSRKCVRTPVIPPLPPGRSVTR